MTAQKTKGTLKQHNATPNQSQFCEIKLSMKQATLIDNQFHMLLCHWKRQQRAVAKKLCCVCQCRVEHGGATRRQPSTSGDVEEVVEGQQPSSKTATSTFVQGETGGALPEPCKLTSSRPQMCMCLLKRSETDSMRVVCGPDVHRRWLCLQPKTVQDNWHLPVNTKSGKFATGALYSS